MPLIPSLHRCLSSTCAPPTFRLVFLVNSHFVSPLSVCLTPYALARMGEVHMPLPGGCDIGVGRHERGGGGGGEGFRHAGLRV